ncbi:B3 domain-containing protein REM13-like [Gossypium australe]|uniref:B3 domain-containing protein REM13-like n=1 Tax=Gossypium australe TaxID=47621 RepID=A0A5B6UKS2_9ROSI|nr:B3 domain-containing protein REM13-like [Gossypium australe]
MRSLSPQEAEFVSEVTPKHVSFQMVVKEYHEYYVYSALFCQRNRHGKGLHNVIKDPRGGMWPMKTAVSREQVRFGCGWFQFLHGNEKAAGDTLLFEHFPNTGNFIHVQVINKGGNGNCGRLNKQANPCEDTSLAAKRPRGRPRKQIEEPPSTKYAPSTAF